MDYVDSQIMDNLIRAKNGLPIVHYDFSHIGGVVADKLPITISGGQTLADSPKSIGMGGIVNAAARSATRPFAISTTPERDNTIDVEVLPITSEKQIYAAYVAFLCTTPASNGRSSIGTKDSRVTTETVSRNKIKPTALDNPTPTVTETTSTLQKDEKGNPVLITKVTTPPTPKPPPQTDVETTVSVTSGTEDFNVDFDKIQSVSESPTPPQNSDDVLFGQRQWHNGKLVYGPKKWIDGHYYWVSKRYKSAFFKLCLATVARGYASASAVQTSPTSSSSPAVTVIPGSLTPGGPAGNGRTPQQLFEDFGSTLRQLQNQK